MTTADAAKKAWGASIAAARRDARRSQTDVARAAGVDQKTVSNAEHGTGRLESFVAIATELGVELLGTDQ